MQIQLTGHRLQVTPAMRKYVHAKLERIERHFDNLIDVNIILNVEKLQQNAEAKINVRGGEIFADSSAPDMYAAIDGLVDKLDRQVKKHKEKQKDHHRSEHRTFIDNNLSYE